MNNLQKFIDYLDKEKNYSKHTVLAYSRDIESFNAFVKNNYDGIDLAEINYVVIRNWIVQLLERNAEAVSVNRKVSSLNAFYKFLLKTKQVETNPLQKHKSLKTPKKIQIPFSENELNKVLEQIPFDNTFSGIRDKLIIELFYTTGIRRSELINLESKNVDFNNATIKVLGKRDKERIIPLLEVTKQLITQYLIQRNSLELINDTGYLFLLENGNKLNETFVYRLINYYFSNVSEKVKKSPHMLRHTFATHMLNHGADLNSIKELLGHSSLASTQVYTHSSLTELKNVYLNAHPRNQK